MSRIIDSMPLTWFTYYDISPWHMLICCILWSLLKVWPKRTEKSERTSSDTTSCEEFKTSCCLKINLLRGFVCTFYTCWFLQVHSSESLVHSSESLTEIVLWKKKDLKLKNANVHNFEPHKCCKPENWPSYFWIF